MPIGPDFHDKPPPEKIPPIRPMFVAADPPFLRTIQLDENKGTLFTVKVEDPNVEDSISVLWVLNYPLFSDGATRAYPPIKQAQGELMQPFTLNLTCKDVKPYPAADRLLTVIASDNDFYMSPDTLPDMQNRLNYDADGKYLPTMNGWSVAGCP